MSLYLHSIRSTVFLAWCLVASLHAQQTAVRTAQLVAYKSDKRETGSAFFIYRDGTAITCYHVIRGAYSIDAYTPGGVHKVTILSIDPVHDLAKLKIADVASIQPFPPHKDLLLSFGKLTPILYPGFLNGRIQNKPLMLQFLHPDLSSSKQFIAGGGDPPFAIDIHIIEFQGLGQHGMSGSPIVDEHTGEAIGVLEGSLAQAVGTAWAIPLEYLDSPKARAPISPTDWPSLELLDAKTAAKLGDSIPLVASFEPHLVQVQKDRDSYRDLVATMDQTFDACLNDDNAWDNLAQTLPDGLPWPLDPDDIPDVATFNRKFEAASKSREDTCGKAQEFYRNIKSVQDKIVTDISRLTQDLEASKPTGANTYISAELAKDLDETHQSVIAKIREAVPLRKKLNGLIDKANEQKSPSPIDTGLLKAVVRIDASGDMAVISDDSRKSVRLLYEAGTEFLALVSDNIAMLAAIPEK